MLNENKFCIGLLFLCFGLGINIVAQAKLLPLPTKSLQRFSNPIYISLKTIDTDVICNATIFDSSCSFHWVDFTAYTGFSHSVFEKLTFFNLSSFHKPANFSGSTFKSQTFFRGVKFYNKSNFESVTFNSNADFSGVIFDSIADFSSVDFKSMAIFSNARWNGIANFNDVYINILANFDNSEFNGKTYFCCTLPDTLNFNNVRIQSEIDFTLGRLDSLKKKWRDKYKCRISLVETDLNKIKLNYELFQLYFPQGTPNEIKISIYEKLLKKFIDAGYLESYKNLDIEYQDFKYKMKGGILNIALNWFLKNWWNYGYNKELVVYWTILLFIVFSLLNSVFYNILQEKAYHLKFDSFDIPLIRLKKVSYKRLSVPIIPIDSIIVFLKSFHKIFANSLLYTATVFFGLKISLDKLKKLNGWTIYILIIYIIGLFCLACVVNIIILK